MNEHLEANRKHWDDLVPIHLRSDFYNVQAFKAGESKLKPVESAELTDVRGKTMLHLQCHFGMDTLSWAMEGAQVTGVDFSEPAIEAARALSAETGIEARFLVSDVYSLPENLDERFDIVFTSYGVVFWLPDVKRWAEVAARFLQPGGTFYMVEFHPFSWIFDDAPDITDFHVKYRYFNTGEPFRFEQEGTYADRDAKVENKLTYSWPHTLGDIVSSLIDAGLRIEFLHEFPFTTEKLWPFSEFVDKRTVRLTKHDGCVPLLFSIKAAKPE